MAADDDVLMGGTDTATSAGPSSADLSSAGLSSAGLSSAGLSSAGPSAGGPSAGGPSSSGPSSGGPSSAGISSADPVNGIDILGGQVKKLVQAIDKLQTLGIETTELPLPKIVVVGDQSAGKSSLIEGISGIKVPRSSGTCTRCPLQITLTPTDANADAEWSCSITIQKNFDYYSDVAPDTFPYGRWSNNKDPREMFFAKTNKKADLEDLIRRAQIAVLNPGDNPAKFLHGDYGRRVDFSPNIIKLEIRQKSSPSLSFVDLPGVITQTEDAADMWLVTLVKRLVVDFIATEHTLILLACSMESDMANSHSSRIVADCPGAKERTVGVLTKPDRRPADNDNDTSFGDVKRVLENKSFKVGHGYFVAMQPGQQLDITVEAARKQEAAFFATQPWSSLSHLDRFGTSRLQEALAYKLADRIIASLPNISAKINSRLDHIEEQLQNYPDPPANALSLTIEALTTFKLDTQRLLDGIPPYNQFRTIVRNKNADFARYLARQSPLFKIGTPAGYRHLSGDVIDLCDSDDDLPLAKRARIESTPTPAPTPTPIRVKKAPQTPQTSQTPQTPGFSYKTFTLLEIRKTLEDLTSSDIPGEVDPRAVNDLRLQCLSGWEKTMNEYLDETAFIVQKQLDQVFQQACNTRARATEFYREAMLMLTNFVNQSMSKCRENCQWTLHLELYKPMTLNPGFDREIDAEVQLITSRRDLHRLEDIQSGKSSKKKIEDLGPDLFKREIDVMAGVRGYYKIAMYRFLDRIVQEAQQGLERCRDELHEQLVIGLELNGADAAERAERLLAEDPGREAQRLLFKAERKKLMEAQVWLQGLDG